MNDNSLVISKIIARPVSVPFRIPPKSASGTISDAALVLIDIETNQEIVGRAYLFAYSKMMLKPTVTCVEALNNILVGEKLAPFEIDTFLRNKLRLQNTGGILGQALAGIDMAVWDAFAQHLGQPLAQVLGGEAKPVKAYNSCGLWIQDPKEIADEALQLLEEGGFKAIKARVGRENFEEDLSAIRNIKQAISEEILLMCDFNQSLNVNEAVYRCKALDCEGLYWIEDPIRHDNYEGCAKIAAEVSTPLQIGENLINIYEMQKAVDAMAGDYYMPDVQRIGGVTGWLRAASIAHVNDIDLSSHLFPEISCHLLCVTPTCHWLEYMDWATPILQNPLIIKDGLAMTPDTPGTGVNWDETAIEKYLVN